ncbi:MAG: hypothetical protein ACTSR8_12240 [Promethearchaeota archaeon]
MNKSGVFFLCFFLINLLIAYCSSAFAQEYEVGFTKDDVYIWSCNVCDEEQMEEIFGIGWEDFGGSLFKNLKEGAKMKWEIKNIAENKMYSEETEENETTFLIEYNIWRWTENEDLGSKDSTEIQETFVNPNYYKEGYIYPDFAPMWLPTPVGEYMKSLEPVLDDSYTIDGRVLLSITCKIEMGEFNDQYPKKDIKVLALYNAEGILRSYKLYIANHQVILDISLDSTFGIETIFVILLAVALIFATIYIIFKIIN